MKRLTKPTGFSKDLDLKEEPGYAYIYQRLSEYENMEEQGLFVKMSSNAEEKRGRWVESKCIDDYFWLCSSCNFCSEAIAAPFLYNYCPNCGAKMEK